MSARPATCVAVCNRFLFPREDRVMSGLGTNITRMFLVCLMSYSVSLVAGTTTAGASVPGDAAADALPLVLAGDDRTFDLAQATTETSDPVPSCLGGGAAQHTVWTVVRPSVSTLLRIDAGTQAGSVAVLYAAMPIAGTEIACTVVGGDGGRSATAFEHLLIPDLSYVLMLGTRDVGTQPTIQLTTRSAASAWHAAYPLPTRRQGIATAADAKRIYAFGGLQTSYATPASPDQHHSGAVTAIDPVSGRTTDLGTMPVALSYAAAARVGSRIYLPGGRTNARVDSSGCMTRRHLVFDVARRTFADAPQFTGTDTFDYAVVADSPRGRYLMIGGATDPTPCDIGSGLHDVTALGTVRSFDVRSRAWVDLPPMSQPRQGAVAQMALGVVVVAGGLAQKRPLASTELFDPRSRRWYAGASMPYPVWGAASGVGRSSTGRVLVYVTGGWTVGADGAFADTGVTQIYDVLANRWSVERASRSTPREALAGAVVRGRLFAIGGFALEQPVRDVECLRIDRQAPAIGRVIARVGALRLVRFAARASDVSGIASYRWRFAEGGRATGRVVTHRFARSGRQRAVLSVTDTAGNTRVRTVIVAV